ncbi:MAG: glycosyltransferase family 4 protein [Spirochaetia bacterium]|nr:glycosyltransferase family 4 protein [Spirochaetia bacterium]
MNIAVYIKDFIYKFGGTESYTANLIESLQKILNNPNITILTEYYKKTVPLTEQKLINTLNDAYGVEITEKNVKIKYIQSKENKNRLDSFKFQLSINKFTKNYDLFFYCSKGLLTGNAKKNIAIIHFPMDKKESFPTYKKYPFLKFIAKKADLNYINKYDYFIPNSNFTKYWLQQKWNMEDNKIQVLYPPVTKIKKTKEKQKDKILICSRIEKSKKIDKLIYAYTKSNFLSKNTKLIIAGSTKNESPEYVKYLQNINPSVEFIFNPSREKIEDLYASSYIFWHAKGYEELDPYQMEHFGITTVEAMSAKCIPIVINKGGQTEIVTDESGFKWNNLDELIKYTEEIYSGKLDISSMQKNCIERSNLYSKENYQKKLLTFIQQNITTENK